MSRKPSVEWYPAHPNNYTSENRPFSNPINKVIIHVVQGSFSSAINYFQNPDAYVSTHYTVRSNDGFIGQSVSDTNTAYHAGNYSYNETSIGIEHEGYVSNPDYWFTAEMYKASAKLTAFACDTYDIPINRNRIIGHSEVPRATHTDPGDGWNWGYYMNLVRRYSGGRYSQVVNNDTAGRFYAPAAWGTSSYSSQRRGKNYRFIRPDPDANSAFFRVRRPTSGRYAVFAWWPADPGYNNRVRVFIRTVNGWEIRGVNQRRSGGQWSLLGSYQMDAGDSWAIAISSRSRGSGYIIADAVAVVRLD